MINEEIDKRIAKNLQNHNLGKLICHHLLTNGFANENYRALPKNNLPLPKRTE